MGLHHYNHLVKSVFCALEMSTPTSYAPFLSALAEALELEDSSISPTTTFSEIDWDSLAIISAIALVDEYYNVTVSAESISNCTCIPDLLSLIDSYSAS